MLGPKCRRTHDRLVLVDVRLDRRNLVVGVTQYVQCARHRLIDDRHVAAAHELLELHESEIGLDAGGVTVHQQSDGPGGRQYRRLSVSHTVTTAEVDGLFPGVLSGLKDVRGRQCLVNLIGRVTVHAQHVDHGLGVLGEALVRPHATCGARTRRVRVARHERRYRGRPGPARVRVVGEA